MKQDHLYLVYGASGAQGGAVANRLLASGKKVRSITRNPEAADLLQSKGIEAVVGDMSDTKVLAQAHEGVDRVFLNIPVEFDTAKVQMYIDHAIEAAVNAKVELLVVNTGGFVPQHVTTNTLAVELNRQLIEDVKKSGLPYIIVEPIVYLENFMIPGVLNEGVLAYPVPADQKISWISLDDAAQYHVYALTHPELAGSIYAAPGLEGYTGNEIAAKFSEVLGQEIQFVSLPFEHFEAAISPMLGSQNAEGLKGLYQWISSNMDKLPTFNEVDDSLKRSVNLSNISDWIRFSFLKN
ncbi:uncharacterized protein YbjT (DUF2867 family) [Paenibacillus amylolyticus]|uniref:Uncharacterized protein YbjT (DUF2867 family) n=1 Tax=Paenibacillus amylolyticus TaxID=1451 RepID=A0AAP5GYW2_PAEAM|nr:NmrA family NAD(P)-binding protein [Paenibacillus amylolyticus]MDR6721663.1 uncharacterized protein YbjT (DUF2867 family) [Paenibacillus amylolyticus]